MQTNVPRGSDSVAKIQPVIKAEIDPANPVQEICDVIIAVTAFHPNQQSIVLKGVKAAIEERLKELAKGDVQNVQSVREPDAQQKNK